MKPALRAIWLILLPWVASSAGIITQADLTHQSSHAMWVAKQTGAFAEQSMNWTQHEQCRPMQKLSWWWDYTQFHRQQLADPANAQYLLYLCGRPSWDGAPQSMSKSVNIAPCRGTGDRLRGMLEMTRLAAYSNRVLLFHWSYPLKLEDIFETGDIDWRIKSEYNLDVATAPVIKWYNADKQQPPELHDGSWREKHAKQRVVIMLLMQRDAAGEFYPYWPHFGHQLSSARACIFRSLFPNYSAAVLQRAAAQRAKLGLTEQYTAIHLRLGGMQGEKSIEARFDNFKGLLSALVCSKVLAGANNHTSVLLLTDNELLRRLVAAGEFKGVVGPAADILPAHADTARQADAETHLATFADMALLSQATCLLRSRSGFSYAAWYMGYQMCLNSVETCLSVIDK